MMISLYWFVPVLACFILILARNVHLHCVASKERFKKLAVKKTLNERILEYERKNSDLAYILNEMEEDLEISHELYAKLEREKEDLQIKFDVIQDMYIDLQKLMKLPEEFQIITPEAIGKEIERTLETAKVEER